ncbi:MAG: ABC transporter substrate-binding protein [Coriobacteriia bacterium]
MQPKGSVRRSVALLSAGVLTAGTLVYGCGSGGPAPVVIGYQGALSGRGTDLGRSGRDGAVLAVEDYNASRKSGQPEVRLLVEDESEGSTATAEAFDRLVDGGAIAVIGGMTSSSAIVIAPLANERGVPVVSPIASTDELSGVADSFFRLYPENGTAARELARVCTSKLGCDRVSIVWDAANRAFAESWARHFAESIATFGGSIETSAAFESGTAESYGVATQAVLAGRPDAVFLLAGALDTALLATRLREAGYSGTLITSEWSSTEAVIGYGGDAVEGVVFLNTFDRGSREPAYVSFRDRFRVRFGYEAGFASVHAYDSTMLVLASLDHGITSVRLARVLRATTTFDALQGPIEFDANGDVDRPYYLMTINDREFTRL